jgi:hypothetical protein
MGRDCATPVAAAVAVSKLPVVYRTLILRLGWWSPMQAAAALQLSACERFNVQTRYILRGGEPAGSKSAVWLSTSLTVVLAPELAQHANARAHARARVHARKRT